MENQTKIKFTWIKDINEHINLELDCTIALIKGDRIIYEYEDKHYHLEVDFRVYVKETNNLIIVFKEK